MIKNLIKNDEGKIYFQKKKKKKHTYYHKFYIEETQIGINFIITNELMLLIPLR